MATRYGSYTYGTQHDRSLLAPKAVQQPWYRIWLIAGSIAVFTLTLVSLNTGWPFFSSSSERNYISSTNASPYRDMMIAMHPNEHKWRGSQTREHTWNITSDFLRPDGVRREIILINDNFPGPTIEARPGDTIVVHVQNFFRESVSVHWHGLQMRGSNHMDGPVGITQCAIPPGGNFTYRFDIGENETGTFWYHAHSETQRGDGLYGGLVVHEPTPKEIGRAGEDQEILLLVGDWYHLPASQVLASFMNAASNGDEPCPDSLLVNGLGHFDCSRAVTAFPVDCIDTAKPQMILDQSLRYRVRLVNVGSMTGLSLSIAGTDINVTHLDGGQQVASDPANGVGVLYPGERVDFTLEWQEQLRNSESKLVIRLDKENFQKPNLALTSTQDFLLSTGRPWDSAKLDRFVTVYNIQTARGPILAEPLPEPAKQFVIYSATEILNRLHGIPTGFLNRTHWAPQSLPLLAVDRENWDSHQLVPWTGDEPVWVDLVINNMDGTGHPFHLHGHKFFLISSYRGKGGWDHYNPFDTSKKPRGGPFNIANPLQKDTVYVPSFGYVVLRFRADNEGLWALHCHILWHQASGMTMAFQVLGDEKSVFSQSYMGIEAQNSCMV